MGGYRVRHPRSFERRLGFHPRQRCAVTCSCCINSLFNPCGYNAGRDHHASPPRVSHESHFFDGSEGLNAQSELIYPTRFTGKERRVELSGEAYFKVVADHKNRFNVVTPGGITVSAYGTEFNVNAYPDELTHQVTLAKGHVEVGTERSAKKELIVGQKAVLSHSTGQVSIMETDTYVDTAWKDGKMVFRRENLETIVQKLSRKFGVTIHLDGNVLKEYVYTATFTDETLEDILELLKRSAPITYTISKREQLDNDTFSRRVVTIKTR